MRSRSNISVRMVGARKLCLQMIIISRMHLEHTDMAIKTELEAIRRPLIEGNDLKMLRIYIVLLVLVIIY